jgi:hypothetical protein
MRKVLAGLFSAPTVAEQLQQAGTRTDLVQAVARTAFGRQTDRDLLALAAVLTDDEAVVRLLEGRVGRAMGLLALTSRRLVFLPKGAGTATELPLDGVRSASSSKRRGMGRLVVSTADGDFVVDQILGVQAEWMSDDIGAASRCTPSAPPPPRDPLEELADLRALHANGAVDDAEYELRKSELFGRL